MSGVRSILRASGRTAGFAALTSTLVYGNYALRRVLPRVAEPAEKSRWIHAWTQGMLPLYGIDLRVVAGEPRPEGAPYLVVANHRSPLDILVCVHLVGGVVLSHHGVAKMPLVGDAARVTDTIFVDREDGKSGARAIREMRSRLREGRNVIVFPEGTTFAGDEVRPFKRGAFSAARGLDLRVLPIGTAYEPGAEFVGETFGRHLWRMSQRARTPVWVAIGEPRPVPSSSREEEELRGVIQGLVNACVAVRRAQSGLDTGDAQS